MAAALLRGLQQNFNHKCGRVPHLDLPKMSATFAVVAALIGMLLPFTVVSVTFTDLLSTNGGFKVIGAAESETGTAVSMIGDYNKDGKQDFAVAAPLMTVNSKAECGMVLIVLGKDGAWSDIEMSTAASGLSMQRVIGAVAGDNAGTSVGPAGDVNNDGVDDVLIGAANAAPGNKYAAGMVYVLFGKATTSAYVDIDLASFITSVSTGFTIAGPGSFYNLGASPINIRPLGDVNGDKIDDLAVTSVRGSVPSPGAGAVWILYGQKTTFSNINLASLGSAGVLLTGSGNNVMLGSSIDVVGDFNGDGINDIVLGERQYSSATVNYCGAAYLLYGTASWTNTAMASFVTGSKGIRFIGSIYIEYAGKAVSGAGDINDDGKMDLLIAGSGAGNIGRTHVIFGTSTKMTADIDLGSILAANLGFTVQSAPGGNFRGWHVARGGDLDRDGFDDFIVSSGFWLYVLYGSKTAPTENINLKTYTGKIAIFEDAATSVSAGLDVTGDGIPDLLVGDSVETSFAGAAYLMKGPIYPPTPSPSNAPTLAPSKTPSREPTLRPTAPPSMKPSPGPSHNPSVAPSAPSVLPTEAPSADPSFAPSEVPSAQPSIEPSPGPSMDPSAAPSAPSVMPSEAPSADPSMLPSEVPSVVPSLHPSAQPSMEPTTSPSASPTALPSISPSASPSMTPTNSPSAFPSVEPSAIPSVLPSTPPSASPSILPTADPSALPTVGPSSSPTIIPTAFPTATPTVRPTAEPQQVVLDVQQV